LGEQAAAATRGVPAVIDELRRLNRVRVWTLIIMALALVCESAALVVIALKW
jgi:hypothetical protein